MSSIDQECQDLIDHIDRSLNSIIEMTTLKYEECLRRIEEDLAGQPMFVEHLRQSLVKNLERLIEGIEEENRKAKDHTTVLYEIYFPR